MDSRRATILRTPLLFMPDSAARMAATQLAGRTRPPSLMSYATCPAIARAYRPSRLASTSSTFLAESDDDDDDKSPSSSPNAIQRHVRLCARSPTWPTLVAA